MERKEQKIYTKFSAVQNILAGIACSFYLIYKYYLSEPSVIKDFGSWYPWFLQVWLFIMVFSAGLSGPKLWSYVIKYLPIVAKAVSSFKKSISED